MSKYTTRSDSEEERVVVLGGTGFIGKALVKLLAGANRRVFVLTRDGSEENRNHIRNECGAEPLVGDLLREDEKGGTQQWKEVLRDAAYVVYSAQPDFDPEDKCGAVHEMKRLKMLGNVLESIGSSCKLERFLLVSGSSYLGACTNHDDIHMINETSAKGSPIGIGPLLGKEIQLLHERLSTDKYVIGLVGGVYGPRSWFTQMYLAALQNKSGPQPVLMHDPPPVWPYIHIEDVARSLEFLLFVPFVTQQQQRIGGIDTSRLVLLTHELLKIDEFVKLIATHLGMDPSKVSFLSMSKDQMKEMKLPPILIDYLSSNLPHKSNRLESLGFQWKYQSTNDGLRALLGP